MNVFITGAGSGVGLALAKLLHSQGHLVCGTTRNPAAVAGAHFKLIAMEMKHPASVKTGYQEALTYLDNRIDVLVLNAGYGELGSVEDTPIEDYRDMMEVNYLSQVELVKAVLTAMRQRKSGYLLFTGSVVFELQFPFKAGYCATKSALSAFALSLAHEVAPFGIRTHLFEPGWIRSEFHNRLVPRTAASSVYYKALKPFLDFSSDQNIKLPNGEQAAAIMAKVLTTPAPLRIPIGPQTPKLKLLKRLLSDNQFQFLLRFMLRRKNQSS
jgi:NAD(P)-dependent dehydrogenase (short-subunit alcohol dehydrogenase family)